MKKTISAIVLCAISTASATPRPPVFWFEGQIHDKGVEVEVTKLPRKWNAFGKPIDDLMISVEWTPAQEIIQRGKNHEVEVRHAVTVADDETVAATFLSKPNKDGVVKLNFRYTPSDLVRVIIIFEEGKKARLERAPPFGEQTKFILDLQKYIEHNNKTEQGESPKP